MPAGPARRACISRAKKQSAALPWVEPWATGRGHQRQTSADAGTSAVEAWAAKGLVAGGGRNRQGTCEKMQKYYTPALAALVSEYARSDLDMLGYPEWMGDTAEPWY